MANLRDHAPVVLDAFNGLWARNDKDSTPLDHFQDCENVEYFGAASFRTRPGIGISQTVDVPLENILRIYNYPTQLGNTLIILARNPSTGAGEIYHYVDPATIYGPVLTIDDMEDFAFLPYAGRAYISPFKSYLQTLSPPSTPMALALANGSGVETGIHKYASTYLTSGGETSPSVLSTITTQAAIADPTTAPLLTTYPTTSPGLTVGLVYKWKIAYQSGGGLTLPTTVSGGFTYSGANATTVAADPSALVPAGLIVSIYRCVGNDFSTFYLEGTTSAAVMNTPGGGFIAGQSVTDAVLITRPVAPTSNTTGGHEVLLSAIPVPTGINVLSKNIYRTQANATQLQLLTNLANATTTFDDTTPDASLGANAPTTNGAIIGNTPIEKGLENEFLYVYLGDGTAARKAAGVGMAGTMTIAFGAAGNTDAGFHIFGFVSETDTGYLAPPSILKGFTTVASNSVSFGAIPTSGDPSVTKRHLVATKVIPTYSGNINGYTFYFVPNATINNNTDTFLNNISFFDADLLDDASHLSDNYTEIPAGAVLSVYHDRLILAATFNDISLGLVSAVGEPEAISQIDGLIIVPLDGNPITNAQELRDVLYVTKRARTVSFTDTGDVPSSWPLVVIDNALGTSVHGIATVLDSGSSSVDYLIICTYQGISLFNGRYVTPELSFKIESYWQDQDRANFKKIQILNEPIHKVLYIILPSGKIMYGNYANGMDPKKIRWCPWSFFMTVNTIAIVDIDTVIIGADFT